jgi:propanol-preferring alcohol dehydrogenase
MGRRVVGIDTGNEKEELIRSLGAEVFLDFRKGNMIEQVKKATGGGAHAAIVVAASPKPYEEAMQMVRALGTVVAVGLPSHAVMGADVFDTVIRCITIHGSYVY